MKDVANLVNWLRDHAKEAPNRSWQRMMNEAAFRLESQALSTAALTDALKKNVSPERFCRLCKHNAQCDKECLNTDDMSARYWNCKNGEYFEFRGLDDA